MDSLLSTKYINGCDHRIIGKICLQAYNGRSAYVLPVAIKKFSTQIFGIFKGQLPDISLTNPTCVLIECSKYIRAVAPSSIEAYVSTQIFLETDHFEMVHKSAFGVIIQVIRLQN